MTRRFITFLTVFLMSSAAWSGGRGEIGLRLKHEGLVWRIIGISPDGDAARVGLHVGDVVIQINDLYLPSEEQLLDRVTSLKPGDVVTMSVLDRLGIVNSYSLEAKAASDQVPSK